MYGITKNGRTMALVVASIVLDTVKLLLTDKGDTVEVWEADSYDHCPSSYATSRTFYHNGDSIIYFEESYYFSDKEDTITEESRVAHFRARMGWGKAFPGKMYGGGGQKERAVVKRTKVRALRRQGKLDVAEHLS
jgi:hypothetical protein